MTIILFRYNVTPDINYDVKLKNYDVMKVIANLLLAAFVIFWACIVRAFLGALTGWVIGLMFGDTILGFFAALGITGFKMWQIGLVLGFIGGFFANTNIKKTAVE